MSPKATINVNDTEKHELKTCENGFVVLKRLSYGSKLKRQEMALKMSMEAQKGGRKDDVRTLIDTMQRASAEFDFKNCIVDHNLENDDGQPLDFRSGYTLDILDPRIGEEIGTLIDAMNNFEESDEGNSPTASEQQLS